MIDVAENLARWVEDALRKSGMSQAGLAEALESHLRQPMDRSKVNKMVLGKRALSAEEMIAISAICGVDVPAKTQAAPRPVAVVGKVGAGAQVPLVDAYAKGDGLYHVARPPQLPPSGVAAVEVEGDSMAPMYQPGHVLFFSRHSDDAVLETDIGKPCVIEDINGMAWVKVLRRGDEPGCWNLISLNQQAETVWNAKIKWAARVMLAMPAEFVEVAK